MPMTLHRIGMGEVLNRLHLLILTTRGRKSGQPRHTTIEYRRHGSKIYIISGWGKRPDWYKNLLDDPLATLQVGGQTLAALADPVKDPAEALRAINLFRRSAPARYDAVLGRLIEDEISPDRLPDLSHQFTIMRLDLIRDVPTLPGVPADWVWIWPVAAIALITATLIVNNSRNGRSLR